ncbi:hypothetical protein [Photobacterium sp.]|uniref:hypothetical protein n=1 Tax=Photobacterium sp. TaxID=660 RepID=UPI00299EB7F5|nr:hypothetical protein [Photobacterium sp.]MDX1302892.1 hypothetical protein [Photobacterium sp.]
MNNRFKRVSLMCFTFPAYLFCSGLAHSNTILEPNIHFLSSSLDIEQTEYQDGILLSWLDESQGTVSDTINEYSTSVDHFIGKKENEEALVNRSYLRIRFRPRYTHREYFDFDSNVYLKLDLPHTKKNWKLILETDPDDYDSLENKQRDISDNSENGVGGAIGGVSLQDKPLGQWKADYGIGLKIKLPLDPFVKANLRRIDTLSENWTTRIHQEIFYYHSKGPGLLTSLDFYYAVNKEHSKIIKSGTSAQFLDSDNNWELVQQVEYYHRINETNSIEYSVGASADTGGDKESKNFWLSTSWKQRLYKDWLYLKISPDINFKSDFDYKVNPGIMMELELFFSVNGDIDRLHKYIPKPEKIE